MSYLSNKELHEILQKAEIDLLNGEKIKFKKCKDWRMEFIPEKPGVYALFEDEKKLIYIGETGNLHARMNEINRTVNHTFRKQLGHTRYGGTKSRKKFDEDVEDKLNQFFEENLYLSYIPVNYGRLEIETHIITKYQKLLLNSEKKRKVKMLLDEFEIDNL